MTTTTKNREIDNTDLRAAMRGLGMRKLTYSQLLTLARDHEKYPDMFASRVISRAARDLANAAQCGQMPAWADYTRD